ncbi:MAG: helicase-related protein, partial [Candidatus Kapabacteria bacterium]|nr:helicase-related protein [Candidatus Kapabacteria bacterium]
NFKVQHTEEIKNISNWFEDLWNNEDLIEDVKETLLNYLEGIYQDKAPQDVYYKTLAHILKQENEKEKEVFEEAQSIKIEETVIWNFLYSFQQEGFKKILSKLELYNGCILADSVGLGKTFTALAVIKYFELKRLRVLVICPKRLEQNWQQYQANYVSNLQEDNFQFKIIPQSELTLDNGKYDNFDFGNFDLLVIDESHNFRNQQKSYKKVTESIIRSGRITKVLLLSATPVNNKVRDLRNQYQLFQQDAEVGDFFGLVQNNTFEGLFQESQRRFNAWSDNPKNETLIEALPSEFINLLRETIVARSRKTIREMENSFTFPDKLQNLSFSPKVSDDFLEIENIVSEFEDLELAMFNPARYVKDEFKEKYGINKDNSYKDQLTRERSLIGMLKFNYLKRLESSVQSFEKSMQKAYKKIEELINRIESKQSKSFISDISEIIEDEESEFDNELFGKKEYNFSEMELDIWLKDLKSDKTKLNKIYYIAKSVPPDEDLKLQELKGLVKSKIEKPINEHNKKMLIFTAYSDTAEYLYDSLINFCKKELNVNIALIVGGDKINKTTYGETKYHKILTNFSPKSKNRNEINNEEIDILIATDCISEGQNLQDCDMVVNYDIHWNPVRVIQRFGRIDRIGSQNKFIQMVNFWPHEDIDKYLELKSRVHNKMKLANFAATGQDNPLDNDDNTNYREENQKEDDIITNQLKSLKDIPIDIEDMNEGFNLTSVSFDEFRNENFNSNLDMYLKQPDGIFSIVPSPNGEYKDLEDFSKIESSISNNIISGVIFFLELRDIGNYSKNKVIQENPIKPYYLIYINSDGKVRYKNTNIMTILRSYKSLCENKEVPYKKLCEIFEKETNGGSKVESYSELLNKSISDIISTYSESKGKQLFARNGIVPRLIEDLKNDNNFKLITWLIIK